MDDTVVARRVTAADVARSAGVSPATVGFVINKTPGQTISEPTRQRVLRAARELGFRPRAAAQSLRSGRTRIVLLELPDRPIAYGTHNYIEEAGAILDKAGYALITYTGHEHGRSRPLWEILDPDVIIAESPFDTETVTAMRAHGIAHIITPGESGALADTSVYGQGPRLQVEHLHALGHRRLAIASTAVPLLAAIAQNRAETAQLAGTSLGLPAMPIVAADEPTIDLSAVIADWVAGGVTGVVAYNDEIAALVTRTAIQHGISVPGLVSVIGIDDSPMAPLYLPSLSSVRINETAFGRLLAELALERLENTDAPQLADTEFEQVVARESTAAPAR